MITFKKFIPGIAWFFLVLILICLPGSQFPKKIDWLENIYFDKWVHAGLFGMLGLLFMWPITKSNLSYTSKINWCIKITLAIIIWGLTTEYIQKYFIPFRSFDWMDWLADNIGVCVAFLLCKKQIKQL
jgi:VanZ family protein